MFGTVFGHGAMTWPPQRGITNGFNFAHVNVKDDGAQSDWYAHFPAGDKGTSPGAAMRSQRNAAGPEGWKPYDPFNHAFKWRAGVCGDTLWGNDHLRGGKYYNGGKIHATYDEGGHISVDLAIVAHHNGYMELFVCDVARCAGEISQDCFRHGACHRLNRVWDESCESRNDWKCAPIDPNYPSRWYLPCGKSGTPGNGVDIYGHGKIKYQLPAGLTCEHCVVQWYWVAANDCNPPGVVDFYKSDRAPHWGDCPGQGEAKGGWRRWETMCDGPKMPEEYFQCADIRINPKATNWNQQWGTAENNHVGARGRKRSSMDSPTRGSPGKSERGTRTPESRTIRGLPITNGPSSGTPDKKSKKKNQGKKKKNRKNRRKNNQNRKRNRRRRRRRRPNRNQNKNNRNSDNTTMDSANQNKNTGPTNSSWRQRRM